MYQRQVNLLYTMDASVISEILSQSSGMLDTKINKTFEVLQLK